MKLTIGTQTFDLADTGPDSLPHQSLLVAVDAANTFATAKNTVMNDGHLTTQGKAAKLKPQADALWQQVFVSLENIENERLHWAGREAALYAIPAISTPYEIAMDRERRDWFRALARGDKASVIDAIKAGADHAELVAALLRSPVPLGLDGMARLVEEIHQANCRAASPDEWELIQTGRQAVATAERGMGHVVGISCGLTERPTEVVLRLALSTGHERAAGLIADPATVADVRRRLAAEQQRLAA